MVGTAYLPVSAGSPGPLDRKTPSGRNARISLLVAVAGTTVTEQPQSLRSLKCCASPRIDRDHMKARLEPLAVTALERPARLVPVIALGRADRGDEVHAVDAGPAGGLGAQRIEIEGASAEWAMTAFGMPWVRMSVVSARVSIPVSPMRPRALSQASSRACAKVGRFAKLGTEDRADRGRRRRGVDDLDILVVDPDNPYMREGEGDDLGGVGRIGQDLLIAGHRCIEADFADRRAGRPDPEAFDHVAVGEHQDACRDARPPSLAGPSSGPAAALGLVALDMGLCLSAAQQRVKPTRPTTIEDPMADAAPLRDIVTAQMKEAMKAGDKVRVGALRLIMAALKEREIEARGAGKIVSRADELALLTKMVKSRQESAAIYAQAGRTELAAQENAKVAVINEFLPKQMDEAEVTAAAKAAIAATGATRSRKWARWSTR